jgi:hypothetical protein
VKNSKEWRLNVDEAFESYVLYKERYTTTFPPLWLLSWFHLVTLDFFSFVYALTSSVFGLEKCHPMINRIEKLYNVNCFLSLLSMFFYYLFSLNYDQWFVWWENDAINQSFNYESSTSIIWSFMLNLTSVNRFSFLIKINKLQFKCLWTAAILFLVTWYANMAKWLSPRYRMRDVHRNPFTFFYRNDLSTSQRVRFDPFLPLTENFLIYHHSQTFRIILTESFGFNSTSIIIDESSVEVDNCSRKWKPYL